MSFVLTPKAEIDLDRIAAYTEERSPRGARRVESELHDAFRLIETFPSAGREVRPGIRRYSLRRYPYLIFYGVGQAGEVRILTIRHAARRPLA